MKKQFSQVFERFKDIKDIRKKYKKKQRQADKETPAGSSKAVKVPANEFVISTQTILKILIVGALFWLAVLLMIKLSNILIMTGIAFFIAIGVSPMLSKLEGWHIPRPLAILMLYVGFFGVIGIMFITVIPIVIEQLLDISQDIRNIMTNNPVDQNSWLGQRMREANFDPAQIQTLASQNITDLANQLRGFAGSTILLVGDIFAGLFNVLFTLVLMFFILLEREKVGGFFMNFLPKKDRNYWGSKFEKVQHKMAAWFKGRLILMASLGVFMYIGMKIFEVTLDMKYAATIAIVTAVMSLFPYIGVFITGILCVLIAINISWTLVVAVLIWVGLSQIMEGNFLEPMIMEKTTGLSSVVVLLAISAGAVLGAALGGFGLAIMGMIFAVPVAASVAIFVQEYLDHNR